MQFPLNLLSMWVTSLSNCRLLKLSLCKKHASHFMCNYRFAEKNLSLQTDFGEVKEKKNRKGQGKILNCKHESCTHSQYFSAFLPIGNVVISLQCFLLSHHLVCNWKCEFTSTSYIASYVNRRQGAL